MKKLLLSLTLVLFLLFSQTGLIAQTGIVYKAKGKISANIENVNKETDPKLTGKAVISAFKKAGQQAL